MDAIDTIDGDDIGISGNSSMASSSNSLASRTMRMVLVAWKAIWRFRRAISFCPLQLDRI